MSQINPPEQVAKKQQIEKMRQTMIDQAYNQNPSHLNQTQWTRKDSHSPQKQKLPVKIPNSKLISQKPLPAQAVTSDQNLNNTKSNFKSTRRTQSVF